MYYAIMDIKKKMIFGAVPPGTVRKRRKDKNGYYAENRRKNQDITEG